MLSAEDILDKSFEKGRGYDKKEVDDFLQEVYDSYIFLQKRNIECEDQIRTLNSGLQHYKAIEASLQKALILAEKTADETIQTAKLKAESIIREAENKAAMYTADSHSELEAVHGKTIGLMQEYVRYKAQFNKLIQEQIELLNGSRFEIQTDDLLAFQKISEDVSTDTMDTVPLPADDVNATKIDFGDVTESDTNFQSAIPEKPDSVEVFKGFRADSEMNSLDYLNAAERLNEEALKSGDET